MKRELKLNFGELGLVKERVTEFKDALANIDDAAAYFDEVLGEQESVAVEALMEHHREMEEEIRYFQDILSQLGTLLENYISDMEGHIMPKDENRMMRVDRNDIWWNMKQIGGNLLSAKNIASGMDLIYYSDIDTTPSEPHIYEGMSPEDESAAWDRYRQQLQESQNRKANYNKLRGFCNRTAGTAKTNLEKCYDSLEELYKKHVVEFENTDDDYRNKAGEVYDACTSFGERWWDNIVRETKFFLDIHKGTAKAAIDFVSGIWGLTLMLVKIEAALMLAVVTMPFGITPQWVKDTGKEAMEIVLGIAQILKNPGRALAALGQKATDTVEEKGIPYAVSYAIADIVIAILVDKGIKKLRGLDKADDLGEAAEVTEELGEARKVLDKLDDVEKMADEMGDVAGAGGLESGSQAIKNALPNVEKATINPKKLTEYALNPDHPVGGNKAKVFESALGYNQSNADDLMRQIYEKLLNNEAVLGKLDEYGQRYTVDMLISGTNGNTVNVRTGWIIKTGSDVPELTTLFVHDY